MSLRISQVTTVKGRGEHVQRHVKRWLDSGIDELVLVDYACPEQTGTRMLDTAAVGNDPRVTIVQVPECVAGRQFHLTRARNLGALASRHELFLFLDADCWVTPTWLEEARKQASNRQTGMLTSGLGACNEELVNADLPREWVRDGQCLVRNNVFHELHGYNEKHVNWGGENYDFYIRAAAADVRIGKFDPTGLFVLPHSDEIRERHLEPQFELTAGGNARNVRFRNSMRRLNHLRRLPRTMAGHSIGVTAKEAPHLQLFRGGRHRTWRPGEDDV